MAHDVFLSYSTKDKNSAEAVCAALERRGVSVWMAPRDIAPGVSWAAAIVDAIDNARAVVLVFSSVANDSPQIEREVQRALDKNLRVIPFRIEDVKPREALAYCIGAVQWLDAFAPPMEAHYEELSKVVRRLAPPQPSPAPPQPGPRPVDPPSPAPPTQRSVKLVAILAGVVVVLVVSALVGSQLWKPPSPAPPPSDHPNPPPPANNDIGQGSTSKPNPPQSAGFGIVFGTDRDPDAAMDNDYRKAIQSPIFAHVVLYKTKNGWAKIAKFNTRDEANVQLQKYFLRIRSDATVVDLSAWCQNAQSIPAKKPDIPELIDCGS